MNFEKDAPAADPPFPVHGEAPVLIIPWGGCRRDLMHLFLLADDSRIEIERYMHEGEVFIASRAGRAIGHAQIIRSEIGETFELKSIAVRDELRGHGIGSRLIGILVRHCRQLGAHRLKVSTSIAAFDAIRFYLRHGFRISGFVRDVFVPDRGYAAETQIAGIALNDAVEFELLL
jgi:GNAT superfamily N-acetyltransferase